MRRTRPTGRRAFTLVELLIVISLIAILAALSAGTLFRLRDSQNASVTEKTLDKLHSMLDTRWKVVIEEARKSVPTMTGPGSLLDACGNDKERAQVVWTYAKIKNEFPETHTEAISPVSFGPAGVTDLKAVLPPRGYFQGVTTTSTPAEFASAALLYASLIKTGGSGNAMTLEGTQQQVATDTATGLTYFKDGWGKPIVFVRHAAGARRGDEINSEPYSRSHKVKLLTLRKVPQPEMVDVFATFDPAGKFIPENAWSSTESAKRNKIISILGENRIVDQTSHSRAFDSAAGENLNSVPTLVSAGANNDFGLLVLPKSPTGADDGEDDILSFRTRREGSRGN